MRSFFLFFSIILLSSCNNDDAVPDIYTGEVTALKNGEIWTAKCYVSTITDSTYVLVADTFSKQGFWREAFDIRQFVIDFKRQNILTINKQNQAGVLSVEYATLIDDGDVVGDIYELDTTATDNFIQILSYNASKNYIEGIFSVSLNLSRDDKDGPTPPEKLEFTYGTFRAKVKKE
jgi:hypothetical protein